jgi:hypothetical protein
MGTHLSAKAQALDDAMVEINKLGLGQLVNVDCHRLAMDKSRAKAIVRMSGQRFSHPVDLRQKGRGCDGAEAHHIQQGHL